MTGAFTVSEYDAELALAQFAVTARDEVDMDLLNYTLVQVVDQTMQPETLSLWFPPVSKDGKDIYKIG